MSLQPAAVADMTATELLRHFRRGALSPVEAAEAALARIQQHNGAVNAFCLVDEASSLEAARRSEQRYRSTSPAGRLDGIPVAIKDVFLTRGWPNLKGSRTVDPAGPWEMDAPAVAALRRHGFVPIGKTTTPELGWKGVTDSPAHGATGNPFAPQHTAGGSSGGSAASVALGMGPLALGTDAGGSIRIPAGFSGVVGHKPTQGRVPLWPASPFGQLAHPGPMTWTVEDAARLMDVITEPDPRDPTLPPPGGSYLEQLTGDIAGLRLAFSENLGYVHVDPEIQHAVSEAAGILEALGAQVEATDPGFDDPREAFDLLFFGGAANALRTIPESRHGEMDPGLIEAAGSVRNASMLDYLAAMNERAALTEHMSRFHQRYDLLLTPTLPIPAFSAGLEVPEGWHEQRWPSWTPFTYPFNLTGQPACSVPCGFTRAGLPIGLQIIGPRHADALVLRVAHAYQQVQPLTHRRPQLLE
ncbi:MAG: amidase [Halorhodospira sp.]